VAASAPRLIDKFAARDWLDVLTTDFNNNNIGLVFCFNAVNL
jgi:hypothetical protein